MRTIILIVVVVATGFFFTTLARATVVAPVEPTYAPAGSSIEAFGRASTTPEELPVRLLIPKIGVEANVQHVGVTKRGVMGVPDKYTDAAWYRYGTVPGKKGSAVIDGHFDNGFSYPGVFKRLSELQVGDDIYVETKGGHRLHFVIEEIARYGYQEVPTEKLFSRHDGVRLNLITCAGSWVPSYETYDERFVVYTRYVRDE